MRKKFIRMLFAVFLVAVPLLVGGCLDDDDDTPAKPKFADAYGKEDTWVVEWYVCGTDLESNYGAASNDIQELLEVKLPDNVKVVIQTGGAEKWQTKGIHKKKIGRYLYDKDGLHEISQEKDADMGAGETLSGFLQFAKDNYPADHRVLVLWNHGGGSAAGICYDERTGHMMRLNDVRSALESVHKPSAEKPPYELVGFDACLMATYDTANTLSGMTKYMVASEEVEPGNGWYYTGWVGALAKNPAMGGAGLGQAICDTYMKGCKAVGTEDEATLSVIDLAKLPKLKEAYEAFGVEALQQAASHPKKFFSAFGRQAKAAENYGGNTRDQGYSDMVDLADLAKGAEKLLPKTSKNLVQAVNDAVIYKVHGDYRDQGSGISGFYSYDNDENSFALYATQDAAPLPHKCLYYYLIYGELPDAAKELIKKGPSTATSTASVKPAHGQAKKSIINIKTLDDIKPGVDKDGNSFVKLTADQQELVSTIHCNLVYMGIESDTLLYLGSDADIDADWEQGIFKDNFRGVWPMLDGHPIFLEITADEEEYNLYSIPIKLNGEECNLQVSYTFKDQQYHILGARKGIGENGVADRNLIKLKKGDKITTIHYAMSISGNDEDFKPVEIETFTIGDNPKLADEKLGDGNYGYLFEFVSPTGDTALSDIVQFVIQNGEITTSVD